MRLFISKYDLRNLILEEHQFNYWNIKTIRHHTAIDSYYPIVRYQVAIYAFPLINAIYHLNFFVL
jgi:hypothetical protein